MKLNKFLGKVWTVVALIVAVWAVPAVSLAGEPAGAPTGPGAATATQSGGLIPCLAVTADGMPLWPTTKFYAGDRQLVAAFQLGKDDTFSKLTTVWTVVDVGGAVPAGQEVGRAELVLNGTRAGRVRYSQEVTMPLGKYHLEALADGKSWKSADLTVVADPKLIEVKSPSALLPLKEGQRWNFDAIIQLAPELQTVSEMVYGKDAHRDAGGNIRGRMTFVVGPTEAAGTRIDMLLDDKPIRQEWWKLDPNGLVMTQSKKGDAVRSYDPPELIVAMPRALPIVWAWSAKDGGEKHEHQMFGPLAAPGVEGAQALTYLVVNDSAGAKLNTTTAWVFTPGYGLGAEVSVMTDKAGHVMERRILTLATAPPGYVIQANDKLKGRMGRLVVAFPAGLKASATPVKVFTDAELKQSAEGGYGHKTYDMLPGKCWVEISGRVVPVEIQSRKDSVVLTGGLRVEVGGETAVGIFADKECTKNLSGFYGKHELGLPVGTVYVKIGGKAEPIQIESGKVAEF